MYKKVVNIDDYREKRKSQVFNETVRKERLRGNIEMVVIPLLCGLATWNFGFMFGVGIPIAVFLIIEGIRR